MIVIQIGERDSHGGGLVVEALADRDGAEPIGGVMLVNPNKNPRVDLILVTPHACVVGVTEPAKKRPGRPRGTPRRSTSNHRVAASDQTSSGGKRTRVGRSFDAAVN